jgi:quinol monooxygenase YgiN
MPLSWVPLTDVEPDKEYAVIATRFGVTDRRRMPQIFSAAQTLISGFASTPGLVGYSLRPDVLDNSLWTLSAWESRAELHQFVGGPAHGLVVERTVDWMQSSRFVSWTSRGSDLPSSWKPVEARMQEGGRDGRSHSSAIPER